jgi:hypothetical protein
MGKPTEVMNNSEALISVELKSFDQIRIGSTKQQAGSS